MSIINNVELLGNSSKNLVLETFGKLYVKVADRYYELDFRNQNREQNNTTTINQITEKPEKPDLSDYVTKEYLELSLGEYIHQNSWDDIIETKEMLKNLQLEGFAKPISPITVDTMQLIVGHKHLQFDFIENFDDKTLVKPGIRLIENKVLVCRNSYILHHTLYGPEQIRPELSIRFFRRWNVINKVDTSETVTYFNLHNDNLPFYLYIEAPIGTLWTDDYVEKETLRDLRGRHNNSEARYVLSETPLNLYSDEYINLLVAVITSKQGGQRNIKYMNGFTEILPGQITAYIFKSVDGSQFVDYKNKRFKIGDNVSGIDWNVSRSNTLTIKGSTLTEDLTVGYYEGDTFTITGGLSGKITDHNVKDDIAAWFGGPKVDKYKITAGNCANTLFRHDGSGYISNGDINWTKDGVLRIGNWRLDANDIISTIEKDAFIKERWVRLDGKRGEIKFKEVQLVEDPKPQPGNLFPPTVDMKVFFNLSVLQKSFYLEKLIKSATGDIRYNTEINTNCILVNSTGWSALPLSTGIKRYSAIIGKARNKINLDPLINSNPNMLFGVYGTAENEGNAPAFGGYFNKLLTTGLYLEPKILQADSTTPIIGRSVAYQDNYSIYISNSTVVTSLQLEPGYHIGHTIMVKNLGIVPFNIIPKGCILRHDSSENPNWSLESGRAAIMIYLGEIYSFAQHTQVKTWSINTIYWAQ